MNDLNYVGGTKYDEYEELLLTRDQLEKEAGSTWTAYMIAFGQLITDIFEEKISCIRTKKMISLCQAAVNRGKAIDLTAVQETVEKEMASYYTDLRELIEDHRRCKESKTVSPYAVRRSKELYRRIARLIHPDTHPGTDRDETLSYLWGETVAAYHRHDVKRLSELVILVNKTLSGNGTAAERPDIPDIDDKIAEVRDEIRHIQTEEPYTLKVILEDPEALAGKKKELEDELDSYKKYGEELGRILSDLIDSGGAVKWRMN